MSIITTTMTDAITAAEERHRDLLADADDSAECYWRVTSPVSDCPTEAAYGYGATVADGSAWVYGTQRDAVDLACDLEMAWLENPPYLEDHEVDDYLSGLDRHTVDQGSISEITDPGDLGEVLALSDDAEREVTAAGISGTLMDSETGAVIRTATAAEIAASLMAARCHILVDDRSCYVEI